MRAFVTGATGFVGRHLVSELLQRQWSVTALVRSPSKTSVLPKGVTLVSGDMLDDAALTAGLQGADVVFHLAAAIDGPWETHAKVTVDATRRFLQLSSEARVKRFVLVSSLAVYDKRGMKAGTTINEDWKALPPDPAAGPYARGKIEVERLVATTDVKPMEVTVMRLGLVYGPEKLIFPHLGELIGERRLAIGDASLGLPLIDINSAVDALISAGISHAAAGRTYHAVDTSQVCRRDYARAYEEITRSSLGIRYLPLWPILAICHSLTLLKKLVPLRTIPTLSAEKFRVRSVEADYDTSRLQQDTGWKPAPDIRAGLKRCLNVGSGIRADVQRVGLIGAGVIAPLHVYALERIPGARLVGILDLNLEAAKRLADPAKVSAYNDAESFWREAQPDIVHVLTPPLTHAAVARDALDRGAHVILEKPAVSTLQQCDELVEIAHARGLSIGVDENVAFDPMIQHARSLLLRGALGELIHVHAFMGFDLRRSRALSGPDSGAWALRLPGGLLEDLLPHPLSAIMQLTGRQMTPKYWQCISTSRAPAQIEDELRLSCTAAGDVTAEIVVSLTARPDDFIFTIYGTRATVRIDLMNMLIDSVTPIPGPRAIARGVRTVRSGARVLGQTMRNTALIALGKAPAPGAPLHLLRAHYDALRSGDRLPAPLQDARSIVAITRAIWPISRPADSRQQEQRTTERRMIDTAG